MHHLISVRPALALLAVAGILTLSARASAEDRPHASRGTAQFVSPTEFVGSGIGTHLGIYTEAGSVQFLPTADPIVLQIDGWSVYTASSGDELHALISGQLNRQTGAITATVTYVGGTGRFENAEGTAALAAQIQPDGSIVAGVAGTIDY